MFNYIHAEQGVWKGHFNSESMTMNKDNGFVQLSDSENLDQERDEKVVIRLSTRNPALNVATRKHYAGNDNVTFLYQDDDILTSSKYWEKLAERANIPDAENGLFQPSITTSSLIPTSRSRYDSYLNLTNTEEDSYYANIEKELRIRHEREKLQREKEMQLDRRITEFRIKIQQRLADDNRITAPLEESQDSEELESESECSVIILSEIDDVHDRSSYNGENAEPSQNYEKVLSGDFDIYRNENRTHDLESDDAMIKFDTEMMSDNNKFELESDADKFTGANVVYSEYEDTTDSSVASGSISIDQASYFNDSNETVNSPQLDDNYEDRDRYDEEKEDEIIAHTSDEQVSNGAKSTSPYSIYKEYFDQREYSNKCSNFNENNIISLDSSDSAESTSSSNSIKVRDDYIKKDQTPFSREYLHTVANTCLKISSDGGISNTEDVYENELTDDLLSYHDALLEQNFEKEQHTLANEKDRNIDDLPDVGDNRQNSDNMQELPLHGIVGTCTLSSTVSRSLTDEEEDEDDNARKCNCSSNDEMENNIAYQNLPSVSLECNKSLSNELDMSDSDFYDCVSVNISTLANIETPKSKTVFKEMSHSPPESPESPKINFVLDELLDASLEAYDRKSSGIDSTSSEVEATRDLISQTIHVIGGVDEEKLKKLINDTKEKKIDEYHKNFTMRKSISTGRHTPITQSTTMCFDPTQVSTDTENNESFPSGDNFFNSPSNSIDDHSENKSHKKRKCSDICLQDNTLQRKSLFKRARYSFLNALPFFSVKKMSPRIDYTGRISVSAQKHELAIADTESTIESKQESDAMTGATSDFEVDTIFVDSDAHDSKSSDMQVFDKRLKNPSNLIGAISEFANTAWLNFESDLDDIAAKDQEYVINEVEKETIDQKVKMNVPGQEIDVKYREGVTDENDEEYSSNKEDTLNEESSANEEVEEDAVNEEAFASEEVEEDAVNEEAFASEEVEEDAVNEEAFANEEVEEDAVNEEAFASEEVEEDAVNEEAFASEEVEEDAVNEEASANEEVEEDAVNEEAFANEEVEEDAVNEEAFASEEVEEDAVNEEASANEEVEEDAVNAEKVTKEEDTNENFKFEMLADGESIEQKMKDLTEAEAEKDLKGTKACETSAERKSSTRSLSSMLYALFPSLKTEENSGSDKNDASFNNSIHDLKPALHKDEDLLIDSSGLNEDGDSKLKVIDSMEEGFLSDSDASYLDAEILQFGDDDIYILPIKHHHVLHTSDISHSPTPSIEVRMDFTTDKDSSDYNMNFDEVTDFIKVVEPGKDEIYFQSDKKQDDVPIINVTSSGECINSENQIERVNLRSYEETNVTDTKISDSKLSAPPVAVRTRSRSPSRKSENSKMLLNTQNTSKIDLSYKANRVISYGSDEDPIELNPCLPRIYPEMVEEADNFIEHDLEKKTLDERLNYVSSDAEEENQQQKIVVKKRASKKNMIPVEGMKVNDITDTNEATFEERLRDNSLNLKPRCNKKASKNKNQRKAAKGVRRKKQGKSTFRRKFN